MVLWYVDGALLFLSAVVAALGFGRKTCKGNIRIQQSTIYMIGALLWPVVWDVTFGYETLAQHPTTTFAFVWPMVMGVIHMYNIRNRKEYDEILHKPEIHAKKIYTDTNSIITIAFAMGTLTLMGRKRKDAGQQEALLYALLLCIAFIIPTNHINNLKEKPSIRASQRVIWSYAIGFVVAAILLDLAANDAKE